MLFINKILGSKVGMFACLSLLLTACATLSSYERPRVYLTDLQFREASMLAQHFLLRLRIDNPNDSALSIDGMEVSLNLNGHPLAQGVSSQSFSVPRFGSTETEMRVTTTFISLVQQILSLQGQRELNYEIAGQLHLTRALGFGRRVFPFQEKGVLDLETMGNGGISFNSPPGRR
ncbi:LEA type 2 family protein [Nitrosococcus watsonii]|uniref:Water Stress and Hypersensitive response domain protein n=1 Tax=Nitrosococcus watsoni (strain C-113) TaxID=105559 RepID=D8K601_NITWC|nr:LEA type 2 family protein [Nitrosococcus watsonii]ADJ28328.1 Water Stress and Hypersensitive response domain protein [Nitrosococcus watsonii C-113]